MSELHFFPAPSTRTSADLLERSGVERFKLGSGELTNLPLLAHVAAMGKPIIMSTGMATLSEVETALRTFRKHGATDVSLLHCVTEYPCPAEQVNLRAMLTLRAAFDVPVGYSDHTEGIEIAIAAVAMGARIIEKHFTLDRRMEGPDHTASLEPDGICTDGQSHSAGFARAGRRHQAAGAVRNGQHPCRAQERRRRPGPYPRARW